MGARQERTFPDGSPLKITRDYQADAGKETLSKNELLAKNWQAIGLDATLNPHPPQGWDDEWASAKTMSTTNWEVGDGPNHLVYPQWLVPLEQTRWAPLQGRFYSLRGTRLDNANLGFAQCRQTVFTGAHLRNTVLENILCEDCDFSASQWEECAVNAG